MKLDIKKNGIWGNGYSGKWKFGKVNFQKMQVWKNANLEKGKFGKMQI